MISKILSVLLLPLSILLSYFSRPVTTDAIPEIITEEEPVLENNQIFDKIEGNGSEFYIVRPAPGKLNAVSGSDFGMSPENSDNTNEFMAAVGYCANNPGTKLTIEPGVYRFAYSDRISFNKLDTCLIDGTGAEFIFEKTGTFMQINACSCFELRGLTIDVDRINNPVSDVAEVRNTNKKNNTLELVFFNKETADENMAIQAITQCDPVTLSFGSKDTAKENYVYMNPEVIEKVEKVSSNVLKITHNGDLGGLENGERYIIRHHVYDGTAISLTGQSHDLTFDGLKIYGSYGGGFAPSDLTDHYQIINTFIGPRDTEGGYVSLGADAIHICNTGGYFNLENCDISGQGDDALNIHDGLGYVYDVNGNSIKIYCSAGRLVTGESLSFKDSGFNNTDFQAVITRVEYGEGTSKTVYFDKDVSDVVKNGYIAYNTRTDSGNYVIRNNYFHENRARALLLQSDNGLAEGNRFYKIEGQAIKIVMDIRPSLWQEGTGVNNLIIRNNSFEQCDYSGWGEQITVDTYIDGHYADCYAFRNIEITCNSFTGFSTKLINAMNVNGLVFCGNTVDASSGENYSNFGDKCANITCDNTYTGKFADPAGIIRAKDAELFIKLNSKPNGFSVISCADR